MTLKQGIPIGFLNSIFGRKVENPKRTRSVFFGIFLLGTGLISGNTLAQTTQPDQRCMTDVSGINGCTANDVSLGRAIPETIVITDPCDGTTGDTATFTATYEVVTTASTRYDIGIWFAEDGDPNGDGAQTGKCSVSTPSVGAITTAGRAAPDDGDSCGETVKGTTQQELTITVQCIDTDGNGKLNVPYCTSWQQNGNSTCNTPVNAVPGAPSKCNCDPGFEVDVPVPTTGTVKVVKTVASSNVPITDSFTLTIKDAEGNTVDSTSVGSSGGMTPAVTVDTGLIEGGVQPAGKFYEVGENDPGSGYSTTISCQNDDGPIATTGSPTSVLVRPDDNVICTINNVLLPVCGDGVVNNTDEDCDGTDFNPLANTYPGYPESNPTCDINCKVELGPYCGDGNVDAGESCDGLAFDPPKNTLPGYPDSNPMCNNSCEVVLGPYCGDGNVDTGEFCDGNASIDPLAYPNGSNPTCNNSCEVVLGPYCGDGNIDTGEFCDGNASINPLDYPNGSNPTCNNSCEVVLGPYCGDGNVDTGEFCDGNASIDPLAYPNGSNPTCNNSCEVVLGPYCGDGNIDTGEQCDGGADCNASCELIVDLHPTRTQGYWKTHPNSAAVHGEITICGTKTYSTTNKQYCDLFKQKGKMANFYRQAGAAALNCLEWGCPSEVQHAINSCDRRKASYLDRYNNGIEGVSAHDAEQPAGHGRANPGYCKK